MTAEIQMPQQHIAIISHSGLHEPWREIVHMGTHLVFPRSHYNHQATTDCFYFIDKGRVRLYGHQIFQPVQRKFPDQARHAAGPRLPLFAPALPQP